MSELVRQQLMQLNRLYKACDEIYHDVSTHMGFSDTTFIIIYGLFYEKRPCTQTELSDLWSIKKQTIHSSMSKLIRDGYVCLESGKSRVKQITLTDAGKELADRVFTPIMNAELAAFSRLSTEEREMLLMLTQKQVDSIHEETKKFIKQHNRENGYAAVGGLIKHEKTDGKQ